MPDLAVELKELKLPLAGGSEGATVTVRPLLTAEVAVPPRFYDAPGSWLGNKLAFLKMFRGAGGDWQYVPVPAFLVSHPTAGDFLIDTGMHRSNAVPGSGNLGRLNRFYSFRMNPGQCAAERLEARGIAPDSIQLVVMTHLHLDHASAVSDFPNATFVCDRAEWAAAHGKRVWMEGYINEQYDIAFDWRGIDYFGDRSEGFAGFSRTVDLFGDGSVRLASTPGHSRGHQSVILRLAHGEILVLGDSAPTRPILDGKRNPLLADDWHQLERTLREINAYRKQTPNALLIHGHDAEAWASLDDVYGD